MTYFYHTAWEGFLFKAYSSEILSHWKLIQNTTANTTSLSSSDFLSPVLNSSLYPLLGQRNHAKNFVLNFTFFKIQLALPTGLYHHIVLIVPVFRIHLLHQTFFCAILIHEMV